MNKCSYVLFKVKCLSEECHFPVVLNSGFCSRCGIKTVVFVRPLPLESKWLHCMWERIVFGTLCPHCTPWSFCYLMCWILLSFLPWLDPLMKINFLFSSRLKRAKEMDTICSCDKAKTWHSPISSLWHSAALKGRLCKNFHFNLAEGFLGRLKYGWSMNF